MGVFFVLRAGAIVIFAATVTACSVSSTDRARLDADIQHTMGRCQALSECSEAAGRAEGMLVMPDITKAALVLGGAYGEGRTSRGWQDDGLLQLGRHVDRPAARLPGTS